MKSSPWVEGNVLRVKSEEPRVDEIMTAGRGTCTTNQQNFDHRSRKGFPWVEEELHVGRGARSIYI